MLSQLVRSPLLVVAIIAFATAPAPAAAQEDVVESQHESMTYHVHYGPAHLADLKLDVECDGDGQVAAKLWANSQGMASRIHPFRVRLDTRLATASERGAAAAQTFIEEKGQPRRYRSRFDDAPRVATESVVHDRQDREIVALPDAGHDLLSWMLELRRHIARDGRQTVSRRYALWDGWKLVWLDVTPGAVEEMETDQGTLSVQTFELERTRLHHDGDEVFEPRAATETLGTLWIEVDTRALPVAMSFEAPIGRVRIEIDDYEADECR